MHRYRWMRRIIAQIARRLLSWIEEQDVPVIDVRSLVGREVQGWALWEVLGKGADGIVYVGERAGEQVAVKVFFPEQLERYGFEQQQQRLELQLQLKGKKHHPNLVEIFDGGFDAELQTLYLVMEYVPGHSLDKILEKLPANAIAPLIKQLASATKFLEDQELVHRDIKPANIVISEDFKTLTLLDLGVVLRPPDAMDDRISGDEFVASVRYSPREFVWRDELGTDPDAWRAVTFYQIGATLHDMIMRYPLFRGRDTPPAKLYEAVKLHPPEISSTECEQWLITLAQACLIKSWRERLNNLSWASFEAPPPEADRSQLREIRLKQVRADELRLQAKESESSLPPKASRTQEIWRLQNGLFLELRQFLMSNPVFPTFSGGHLASNGGYEIQFVFEKTPDLLFTEALTVNIKICIAGETEAATDIAFTGTSNSVEIFAASWREMFSVERAAELCEQAFAQTVAKALENQ
ncbi:protein kinase [Curvibacter sp. RS43]|uniref:serine/threonine protein kinase n=1 Tax=Curvibacter microcysteis TaxID=3026419 RepID=UPI00235E6FC4|nr:protein kinase [Curvibacter sp. RS43]MDD0812540.1 protein kinase [Curvibacter sp. RS43]